jgi:hypothetical protein
MPKTFSNLNRQFLFLAKAATTPLFHMCHWNFYCLQVTIVGCTFFHKKLSSSQATERDRERHTLLSYANYTITE